jgi:hypothetical protein
VRFRGWGDRRLEDHGYRGRWGQSLGRVDRRIPRAIHELGHLEPRDVDQGRATKIARRPGIGEQATPSACDLAALVTDRLSDDSGSGALVLAHS